MNIELLIIPGLGGSGDKHWQTYWLKKFESSSKLVQDNWDEPDLDVWVGKLNIAIQNTNRKTILIAHSLGVSLVVHWAKKCKNQNIAGALLVAPADVDSPAHTPEVVRGFAPMPLFKLPFASAVVASDNDTFVSVSRAKFFAEKWGSIFIETGSKGHINSDSNLEFWEEGQQYLKKLISTI